MQHAPKGRVFKIRRRGNSPWIAPAPDFEVTCEALYWVIYLSADNLLEMIFQVDTELEGIAKLGEGERLARRATLHHEGVVLGIGKPVTHSNYGLCL